MALNRKGGVWEGGYISVGSGGRLTFVIERRVGNRRFHVSTRCSSRRAAIKALERFEGNPGAFRPEGNAVELPIVLTKELVLDFRAYQLAKGLSKGYVENNAHRLADWIEDLGGTDLRKVTLRDHLKPALERRPTCRKDRIIVIKVFYSWLRREKGLLTSAQDATLDLPVPTARPEKLKRRKVVEFGRFLAAFVHLLQPYKDIFRVLAATGWHFTELQRLVCSPESQISVVGSGGKPNANGIYAVLMARHKSGDFTRTPITDPDVVAAAVRLRALGRLPGRNLVAASIKAACIKAGVQPFTPGVMRHSVATWHVEAGEAPERVAEFLGHKDKRTTLRFYADAAVPTVILPSRNLSAGPAVESGGSVH